MAEGSKIEWTGRSDWNPVRGCTRASEGCRNCYAEQIAGRFSDAGQPFHGFARRTSAGGRWTGRVELREDRLTLPLRWRKPATIFVNSTSDIFHESLPDEAIDRIFAVMALAPHHRFQVLTKRADRMFEWFGNDRASIVAAVDIPTGRGVEGEGFRRAGAVLDAGWPLPNVWLGVSIEDQAAADARIPHLLATPAALRFLSCEPLIGAVDLRFGGEFASVDPVYWGAYHARLKGLARPRGRGAARGWADADMTLRHHPDLDERGAGIRWVIAGGESGHHPRGMRAEWAGSLRDQCAAAGVPFFFKQWGRWLPGGQISPIIGTCEADPGKALLTSKAIAGRLLDGVEHNGMPA